MKLRIYLGIVVALGATVLVHSASGLLQTPHPFGLLVFGALAIVTGSFRLNFAAISASISVSDTFFLTTALLFGPGPAALVVAVDSFIICVRRKEPLARLAFNTAAPALSLWIAAECSFALAGVDPLAGSKAPVGTLAVPMLALAAVYFLLNSGLTAGAIALDARESVVHLWTRHFMWLSVGYLAAASAAFCLILLIQQVSLTAAIMVLPLIAVFHLTLRASFGRLEDAQRHLVDLDRLYLSTVETLAMAIDAKDDVTHSHVRRVQAYAVALANALGIDDPESIKAIQAAALLHDTGKLAVPEHILNKPGKLTESEFEKMKLHVDVGADILSLVDFPYPVVPIVRCHHESWDGNGYPRGLKGEDIPIGARILAVVDCFDALTSDRPYRRRMSDAAALDILRQRRGTMYDPRVVDMFIATYKNVVIDEAGTPEQREVLRRIAESSSEAGDRPEPCRSEPGGDRDASASAQAVASDELLAFVSLARIAAGDGTVADLLALSSTLITGIVPDVTGAWYLLDSGKTRLTVAEAFGPAAAALRGTSTNVGQRLTGWVAASRQSITNADAALDLEGIAERGTPPLSSCMSMPLQIGDSLLGVLSLYSSTADAFDEKRGRLVEMIIPHLSAALHAAMRQSNNSKEPAEKATGTVGRDLRLVSAR